MWRCSFRVFVAVFAADDLELGAPDPHWNSRKCTGWSHVCGLESGFSGLPCANARQAFCSAQKHCSKALFY
jgi:hypothetical protein